ncbi:MAG TPA: VWA domain-containing protein, partial [Candidatus Omnitrophota bacterium]|nr:VWA domain-containing protein [Candidatus Omnitrophota bacterium]
RARRHASTTSRAEIAAVLAFSAIRNKDKVGLIIFTDHIEKFMPPRKGVKSVLKVIREVLYFRPQSPRTDIAWALEYLSKVTNRRSVAFLISDFMDQECLSGEEIPADSRLRKALAIANKKHDVIAITLNDRREDDVPACGLLTLEDAETGERTVVDTTSPRVRDQYRRQAEQRLRAREKLFRSVGIDHVPVSTGVPYANELVRFFSRRRRRLK